ncbi:unnamed protein product [Haemonchus placei]|uniref:beta-N-acetylhexosaminidase n=1 Tax=Haemonchus placei TaxID=6290 RepID=A0A0N4X1I6_HAEPC|nr:unnamed protein product [Haemonchus placei]
MPTFQRDKTRSNFPDSLKVDKNEEVAVLTANQVWGALRGLETFSQLVFQPYLIRTASVEDQPRFPHRGTLIDTGRHFLSLSIILQHLDVMSQNKMNVLHWHIVDSESFPYTSAKFPNISFQGAYTPAHIYSIADMRKVIDYARLRGIRVVPEFDTPGHSGSWGQSIPNLLSQCYDSKGKINQLPNIMDPTVPANFNFLSEFFEVSDAIAHVWKGNSVEAIREEMANVTAAGHFAILSSCWLNPFQARVLGGEAALWGEYVDGTNFMARMWPRASAVAERLWSNPEQTKSHGASWPRLHEFRCRMMNRGFAAQPPNAPDYCPFEWNPIYEEL